MPNEAPGPTLDEWVEQVDYIVNLVGDDHVAMGFDVSRGGGYFQNFDATSLRGHYRRAREEGLLRGTHQEDPRRQLGASLRGGRSSAPQHRVAVAQGTPRHCGSRTTHTVRTAASWPPRAGCATGAPRRAYTAFLAVMTRLLAPTGSPVLGLTSKRGKLLLEMSTRMRCPFLNTLAGRKRLDMQARTSRQAS